MKKRNIIITLVALVLMTTILFTACTGKNDDTSKESTPAAKDTLIVGFDASFPPMGFRDEATGKYIGFDLDVAREVAKRLNKEIVLKPIDWASKDLEIANGTIDVIWNGFTMEGREDKYTWTKPYMKNSQVLVVTADSSFTKTDELKGKRIALQSGSTADDALQKSGDFYASLDKKNILRRDNNLTALTELKNGDADAVLMDEVVAEYNIGKQGGQFKILEGSLLDEHYGVGFKLGNTQLRDDVEKTMLEMVKDGTMAKISTEWFGKDTIILGKDA